MREYISVVLSYQMFSNRCGSLRKQIRRPTKNPLLVTLRRRGPGSPGFTQTCHTSEWTPDASAFKCSKRPSLSRRPAGRRRARPSRRGAGDRGQVNLRAADRDLQIRGPVSDLTCTELSRMSHPSSVEFRLPGPAGVGSE